MNPLQSVQVGLGYMKLAQVKAGGEDGGAGGEDGGGGGKVQ